MSQILVVDGNRNIGRLCQVNLERAGHVVTILQSGKDAWELLRIIPFNLVMSDLILPVSNGSELYARIRGNARTGSIPFVLFGIRHNHHTDEEAYALNVSLLTRHAPFHRAAFLVKPFNPREMVHLVNRLLDDDRTAGSAART